MNAKLTDDAVAELPLHRGRAELLEEIMSTPVIDDRPVRTDPPRRRTTWLVPVAAAAAVLALVAASAWLVGGLGLRDAGVAGGGSGAYRAVLDAPGWKVDTVVGDDDSGELTYVKGPQSFEINWYPAEEYDGYVQDRNHITETPVAGEPVQVLGRDALMWFYGGDDNPTAIREVENGHFLELRGKSMSTAAYLALLDDVHLVDRDDFAAAMPSAYVDGTARQRAVDDVLDGISDYVDPLIPPGSTRGSFGSTEDDLDLLGIEVARDVACEWLRDWDEAHRVGDQARMERAVAVLETSRDWPALRDTTAVSDQPELIWEYADRVAAGRAPKDVGHTLSCSG
jgi:hypothetical protein